MTQIVELRTLAHARAGDKGNRSNVSVFAYDPKVAIIGLVVFGIAYFTLFV